jgi:leucyl aminopeptidase (aminopeptidase T)
MTPFDKSIRTILKKSLSLKPKDRMLIVVEESFADIGEAIWAIARRITKTNTLLKYTSPNTTEGLLPDLVKSCLGETDACILLTTHHIRESVFDKARRNGARFVVLQNTSRRIVERSICTNYQRISMLSRKLIDLFSIGKNLHVTSPSGTDITVSISRFIGTAETGMAQNPGELSFLPAGEACVILKGQSMEGRLVIDRLAGAKKKLTSSVTLNVKKGQITQIKGFEEAEQLRKSMRKYGKDARKIYELGIGTNDKVILGASSQEDEKSIGNIHVSFGQDQITKVHGKRHEAIKGIVAKPTLTIDGKTIIDDGNVKL